MSCIAKSDRQDYIRRASGELIFEYKVNVTALKALISFWNRTTHTFLIKTGEMGFSLLDMSEICGLPTYGECYDEHSPSADLVAQDLLLEGLISVHKSVLQTAHRSHKNLYRGFDDWSNEMSVWPFPTLR